MDKAQVLEAIRARLAADLAAVERVQAAAQDEATSSETKSDGKYDTRATEASYLARGQAQRVAALRAQSAWFGNLRSRPVELVQLGALVELRDRWVFLAPTGGIQVDVAGRRVEVISPAAPLGQAIAGLEAGDSEEMDTPRGLVEVEVLSVR